jgi:pseudouridine synthase
MIRLQKILSMAGVASRRTAEVLIRQGRVTVNGLPVTLLGAKADPQHDDIRVDGRRLRRVRDRRYILLNKPTGYVSTRSDPQGRPTVLDLLPRDIGYLYPVGRLDFDSEGLLILTNDGDLAAHLTHPRHEVEKTYQVIVRGVPRPASVTQLTRGVIIDGVRTAPAIVRVAKSFTKGTASGAALEIILREGKNRQIRRMCEAVGHPVERLRRVRIGPLRDSRLKPGAWRDLTASELASLRRAARARDGR